MRHTAMFVFLLLAACGRGADNSQTQASEVVGGMVLPSVHEENGVPVFDHPAAAWTLAQQFSVDPTPLLVISSHDRGDFDLSHADAPIPLADGRFMVLSGVGARLMVFKADGSPERLIGKPGEGPGDFMSPSNMLKLAGDTILIPDDNNHRINWVTANRGVVRSSSWTPTNETYCMSPLGVIAHTALIMMPRCWSSGSSDTTRRPPVTIFRSSLQYDSIQAVTTLPGFERAMIETHYGGHQRIMAQPLPMGRWTRVVVWDSVITSATGEGGYILENRDVTGRLVSRIIVHSPRRAVTQAMKNERVKAEIARLDRGNGEPEADPVENRRLIRESPFADSLPPYDHMVVSATGILWVMDPTVPADSGWHATAFRHDGAIVARLSGARRGLPVWFGDQTVLTRETDPDGEVTFELHRITSPVAQNTGTPATNPKKP